MMPLWVLVFLAVTAAASLDNARIVGGYECVPHSQPWQVYFTFLEDRWCGGSLISSNWIVSAAHCYAPPRFMVAHLGEHDITKEEGTEQHIQVEAAYKHPAYNDENPTENDFMLVKLAKPAQFNQYVQPIPLAKSCPRPGSQCLVSGFGSVLPFDKITDEVHFPDILQCMNLPVLSEASCKNSYNELLNDNMFCAGFQEGGKDSCDGDSGGPLVCNGELYGVVLLGEGCALSHFPGLYTKVCNFMDWVQKMTKNN